MTTHRLSNHPLYGVWTGIKQRCKNSRNWAYRYYGGRGISVCEEWEESAAVFIEWSISHGWESGLEIDRIDNDGNYCPENCRYVTRAENIRNKRFNVGGKKSKNSEKILPVGVFRSRDKYRARVVINKKMVNIGTYVTAYDADIARSEFLSQIGICT